VLRGGQAGAKKIDGVMIGTTHFINAVVQRRHLTKVAALRLGMPASASLPPFCDWPEDLAALVRGGVWMVEGGHEYDGRPFMPLDEAAVIGAAEEMKAAGLASVGISAIFSPLDPSHERRAAELVAQVIPEADITCSSDLGRIGLLERENAGLLNAALADLARDTIAAFEKAIADSGVDAPLFITQNDGTVAEAGQARRLPVYSFASGATNSMRGAAYLSGLSDAMLIAVGGGAFLIPEKLAGVSQVIHVEHGDCANAVGAAIAQVSGECDQIFKDLSRAEALSAAQGIANDRAVAAGAARASLTTIES